jgi:hypothetical protein
MAEGSRFENCGRIVDLGVSVSRKLQTGPRFWPTSVVLSFKTTLRKF